MRKANINKLPGIAPVGSIDSLTVYLRERSLTDLEFLAAEIAGPNAAAFASQVIKTHFADLESIQEATPPGLISYLTSAHSLAIAAATALGSNRRYSRAVGISHLPSTHFTDFLASSLGICERTMKKVAKDNGIRIFTQFGDGSQSGSVNMLFEAHRNSRSTPFEALAYVAMHDSHDFINLQAGGPFIGEGDIAQVPGAVEALMEDSRTVARVMIDEFAGTTPDA